MHTGVLQGGRFAVLLAVEDQALIEELDRQQVEEFCQRYGISRDEVISRMGGSP